MCHHWDALIQGNYERVMPLPWRRKLGFYYLYQPAFTAQLGIFGNELTSQDIQAFIKAIPSKFRLADLSLNAANTYNLTGFKRRKNYILNLGMPYEMLVHQYNDNGKRNVKKALGFGCRVVTDIAFNEVLALAQQQVKGKAEKKDYLHLSALYEKLHNQLQARTYGVYLKQELLASCVFFFSHKRAYYILVGNHPNGRKFGASHLLIDNFIKEYAGQPIVLDFEGSDMHNIAFFYSSFGAKVEPYPAFRYNRLPAILRWLKK
jgi:hypothetical protein